MRHLATTTRLIGALVAALSWVAPAGAQGPPEPKVQFVGGLRQLLEAASGQYGDEGPHVLAAIDSMREALARWDAGIDAYVQSALQADDSAGLHASLGLVYLDRRRMDEALREFEIAARRDSRTADIRTLQGFAYGLAGRTEEATSAFLEAASLDATDPAAAYRLGRHLTRVGARDEARAALERFHQLVWRSLTEGRAPARTSPPFIRVDLLRPTPGVAPIFPPARYAAGFAALMAGRYDEAVDRFDEAASSDPMVTSPIAEAAAWRQGTAALRQGELTPAIEHLRAAVESAVDEAEAHRILGMAYWADEQYDPSIEQLRLAVRLRPDDERARVALGAVLEAASRLPEAEQAFTDAIQVVPGSGQAYYRLGRLYESSQQWTDALRAFQSAADRHPVVGLDTLFRTVVSAALAQPDFDGAIAAAIRRLEVNPNDAEAHRSLAEIHAQQGNQTEALAEFSAALFVDPQDAASFTGIAQAYLRDGRWSEALDAARGALAIDSRQSSAQFVLATALVRLGRREDGARELERFRQLQAEVRAAEQRELELKMLKQEAGASLALGEDEQALEAFRKALEYEPTSAAAHLSVGLVLKRMGRHAEAIEQFGRALELEANPDTCRVLAESHEALGQLEEGRAYRALYARLKGERLRKAGWNR